MVSTENLNKSTKTACSVTLKNTYGVLH